MNGSHCAGVLGLIYQDGLPKNGGISSMAKSTPKIKFLSFLGQANPHIYIYIYNPSEGDGDTPDVHRIFICINTW